MLDFAHNMDNRPRKRQRLTWDMPPPLPYPKVVSLYISLVCICFNLYAFLSYFAVPSNLVICLLCLRYIIDCRLGMICYYYA